VYTASVSASFFRCKHTAESEAGENLEAQALWPLRPANCGLPYL